MKRTAVLVGLLLIGCFAAQSVHAHCEIPCGIYDDEMRIALIREHIDTIEKSMRMIETLTGEADKNYNQIVRWIHNKEMHADELQHIVSQYFMTQRIKPVTVSGDAGPDPGMKKLALLHALMVSAMKSKQTLEMQHVETMRKLVGEFEKLYFEDK